MSTETILIYVLSTIVILLTFITWNLLRKQEKAEDIVVVYLNYLDKLSRVIEISDEKLTKIDERGTFKSDDEVGFFFQQIKDLQGILNEFQMKKLK